MKEIKKYAISYVYNILKKDDFINIYYRNHNISFKDYLYINMCFIFVCICILYSVFNKPEINFFTIYTVFLIFIFLIVLNSIYYFFQAYQMNKINKIFFVKSENKNILDFINLYSYDEKKILKGDFYSFYNTWEMHCTFINEIFYYYLNLEAEYDDVEYILNDLIDINNDKDLLDYVKINSSLYKRCNCFSNFDILFILNALTNKKIKDKISTELSTINKILNKENKYDDEFLW